MINKISIIFVIIYSKKKNFKLKKWKI